MNFSIVPDGKGGFKVLLEGAGKAAPMQVEGFATHQAAQGFIQDYMVKLMLAFRPQN